MGFKALTTARIQGLQKWLLRRLGGEGRHQLFAHYEREPGGAGGDGGGNCVRCLRVRARLRAKSVALSARRSRRSRRLRLSSPRWRLRWMRRGCWYGKRPGNSTAVKMRSRRAISRRLRCQQRAEDHRQRGAGAWRPWLHSASRRCGCATRADWPRSTASQQSEEFQPRSRSIDHD